MMSDLEILDAILNDNHLNIEEARRAEQLAWQIKMWKRDRDIDGRVTVEIHNNLVAFDYGNIDMKELPESEENHIETMIKQGFLCGELNYYDVNTDTEHRGWWEIID